MTNEQTETLLSYQERLINGLILVYKKLDELNGNAAALIDIINRRATELDKRLQSTNRSLESVYSQELIICDILTDLKPEIMKIRKTSDETAGHTLTERNHAFRILQVIEQHTGIDHCDLIRSDEDPEKESTSSEAFTSNQEQNEGVTK